MFFETPEARALPLCEARVAPPTDKGRFDIHLGRSGGWEFRDPLHRTCDRTFLARRFAILHARAIETYERGDEIEADRLLRMTDYDSQRRALGYSALQSLSHDCHTPTQHPAGTCVSHLMKPAQKRTIRHGF